MTELPSGSQEEARLPLASKDAASEQLENMVTAIALAVDPDFEKLELDEREVRLKKALSIVREDEVICIRQEAELFSGPLPHPSVLAGYESIVVGSARQIIDDMLSESSHRRKMEEKALENAIVYTKDGLTKGFVLAVLGIIGGLVTIIYGVTTGGNTVVVGSLISGSVLSGGSIAVLVKKFVDGKQPEQTKQQADGKRAKAEGTGKR